MKPKQRHWVLLIMGGLVFLCMAGVLVISISNLRLPQGSATADRLSVADKARIAETFNLRRQLGGTVWPGWGDAQIPLVLYNETYVFLVGYEGEPPAGWRTVPQGTHHGSAWELVPEQEILDKPYYRQPLPADGSTPQAFAVWIGATPTAGLQTREWMEITLMSEIRADLPPLLRSIFPYHLAARLLLGGSDKYVTTLLHESFHAYQTEHAGERLGATERRVRQNESTYPFTDEGLVGLWQEELDLLRAALQAETVEEKAALAAQFTEQRHRRRQQAGLSAQAIHYEQEREWLEGLAKYVELEVWRQGAGHADYEPAATAAVLDDFKNYDGFQKVWAREVDQIARMADDEGDGRFYYSGMAQAVLLDALRPGWKEVALSSGLTLEELLAREQPSASGSLNEVPAGEPGRRQAP